MRRSVGAISAVALLATLTGCSVSLDDHPRAIPVEARRPLELPGGNVGDTTNTSRIFLLASTGEGNQPMLRSVPRNVPNNPDDVLAALFAGPAQSEQEQGLTSALPSGLELDSATTSYAGTLSIDVTGQMRDLTEQDEILAIAQIVMTASEFNGVDRVRVRVESVIQPWPDSSGNPVTGALSIYDYADLLGSAQPDYPAVPSN